MSTQSGWPQATELLKDLSKKGHEGFSVADSEFGERRSQKKFPQHFSEKTQPSCQNLVSLKS